MLILSEIGEDFPQSSKFTLPVGQHTIELKPLIRVQFILVNKYFRMFHLRCKKILPSKPHVVGTICLHFSISLTTLHSSLFLQIPGDPS